MQEFVIERYCDSDLVEYRCEFTNELDKHMMFVPEDGDGEPDIWFLSIHNYIYDPFFDAKTFSSKDEVNGFVFRYPGSTRGGIMFDENGIITSITFNEGYCKKIYDPKVDEIVDKYIGQKIVVINPKDKKRYIIKEDKDANKLCLVPETN